MLKIILFYISLSIEFVERKRMNYSMIDLHDSGGDISTISPPITAPDIDHRPKRFCEMYYILGLQIYKSPYCHHVEPLEVALKTVGIFKLPS